MPECAPARGIAPKSVAVRAAVAQGYRQAWGRPAGDEEVAAGLTFLDTQAAAYRGRAPEEARAAALADFCHALLNANEFLYVD